MRAKGEAPQPDLFGCFLYHRSPVIVSSWTELPASPLLHVLVMHPLFLLLPLPTVHLFCA